MEQEFSVWATLFLPFLEGPRSIPERLFGHPLISWTAQVAGTELVDRKKPVGHAAIAVGKPAQPRTDEPAAPAKALSGRSGECAHTGSPCFSDVFSTEASGRVSTHSSDGVTISPSASPKRHRPPLLAMKVSRPQTEMLLHKGGFDKAGCMLCT